MSKRYQVVIVGGGPVGVALAVELGLRGISCALVERRLEPQLIPKGQNLTQRSMEHFHSWGVADEVRAVRMLPPEFPMSGIVSYRDLNNEYWYAPPLREIVNSYYFEPNERLPQYLVENVLRKRLAQIGSVEARFGWTAETIEQDASSVRVTIAKDGAKEILEADYVVGCDGSHSTIRRQIGIERSGADFDQIMVLALFRSRELHEKLKRFPPRSTYRVLHPDLNGYWQFFGRVDVGERWFFHSPVPANTTRDNYDFHALARKSRGLPVRGRVRLCRLLGSAHRGRRDLSGRPRLHRRRRRALASAVRRLRPQQRARRRRQSRLEARREIARAGAATRCCRATPKSGGRSSRRPARISSRPAFRRDADFLARYSPEHDRAEFERAWKEHAGAAAPRVLTYEPHYEGSPVVFGPPGAASSASGVSHLQGPRRPSSAAATAVLRPKRVRGAWPRISPCSPSMPMTAAVAGFRGGSEGAATCR